MNSTNNNSIINRSSTQFMKLQIQYGCDIHELFLTSQDQSIRVEQILDQIEQLTKVPKCQQNLLYKGQRIDQKPQANLDDLYIFNNSKLILTSIQRQSHTHSNDMNINRDKSTVLPKRQEIIPNVNGFIPEPNKTYEYYTVPYGTDPTTLLQTLPSSSNN